MTAQRMTDSAEIVQFPERSRFDEAWEARKGQMRKRGDGKEKTRKLWDKCAKTVGQARLLEALKRYLREEKEPSCGYPGLSVFLNGERWDHWIADRPTQDTGQSRRAFPEPQRGRIASALGEGWCFSYLDQCSLDGDTLVIPRGKATLLAKLKEQSRLLDSVGLTKRRWGD